MENTCIHFLWERGIIEEFYQASVPPSGPDTSGHLGLGKSEPAEWLIAGFSSDKFSLMVSEVEKCSA